MEHPQLTLACIAGSNTATEGETLQYTVTLANTGKGPAADVAVAITLPQGVENATPTAPDGTSYAGGIWTVPALAVGESMSLVLQATVKGGMADGTDLTAQAQVTAFPGVWPMAACRRRCLRRPLQPARRSLCPRPPSPSAGCGQNISRHGQRCELYRYRIQQGKRCGR